MRNPRARDAIAASSPETRHHHASAPRLLRAMAWAGLLVTCGVTAAADPPTDPTVFAVVGEQTISAQDFGQALRAGMRKRFYHGKVPEDQIAAYQREIGQELIDAILLEAEARARGIEPDPAGVQSRLESFEARMRGRQGWEEHREAVLARVRGDLERRSRRERLEASVRDIAPPTEQQLAAYHADNPDKFTEPERVRVSLILLEVDPSAGGAAWDAARQEAATIVRRLRAGADFAETARLRSGDASAAKGGDMGYLHGGMLAAPAEAALAELAVGAVSDPVQVLEGVVILRLDERVAARLNPLDAVRERARELWLREHRDGAWQALLARLRTATPALVNEAHYLPLPDKASGKGG
ncbi:MAG: peptidylprolyl isomerase [Ectothiorhodospiraceae bacterium]|nr:peptidylprolyl isomerase [Chromatiales bacterium]MCP5154599.1 peptidylprolyl isomerase [Ectothiorhodospiraceae bacterium]